MMRTNANACTHHFHVKIYEHRRVETRSYRVYGNIWHDYNIAAIHSIVQIAPYSFSKTLLFNITTDIFEINVFHYKLCESQPSFHIQILVINTMTNSRILEVKIANT